MIIVGYSGHAYVVIDVLNSNNVKVSSYIEFEENQANPYNLEYIGSQKNDRVIQQLKVIDYFIAIGSNKRRQEVYEELKENDILPPINAIHKTSIIGNHVSFSNGILVGPGAIVNSHSQIGDGVILNSGSIVEHEAAIADYAHIAPGAVLAGNVTIGKRSFVGANSVVKQGITIGDDVIIGAGAVVLRDVPNGQTVVGNPAKKIN